MLGQIASAVAIVFGLAGIVSALFVYARIGSIKTNYELMVIANTELREQVESKRNEIQEVKLEFTKQMSDERADCAKSLGLLQGQLNVLTTDFGKSISQAVLQAFKDGQTFTPSPAGTITPTTPPTPLLPPV